MDLGLEGRVALVTGSSDLDAIDPLVDGGLTRSW